MPSVESLRGRPLPVGEVAARLGCTSTWIYRLVAEERLPHCRIGGRLVGGRARRGRIVVYEQQLEDYIASCEVTPTEAVERQGARYG